MIWARPAVLDRARFPSRLIGEVLLVALLVVTAAASWRDGGLTDGLVDLVAPPQDGIAALQVSGNNLSAKPHWVHTVPVVEPAPPPQPRVPKSPPVQLFISQLDVHRAVEKVGVNQYGVMNLPANGWNAGWYTGSPVPGAPWRFGDRGPCRLSRAADDLWQSWTRCISATRSSSCSPMGPTASSSSNP